MWTRFFSAVEHAQFAIETGVIGDVSLVQSDFFDPIYTIQAGPLGFGADASPNRIVATGRPAPPPPPRHRRIRRRQGRGVHVSPVQLGIACGKRDWSLSSGR